MASGDYIRPPTGAPPPSAQPHSKLELSISCENLIGKDFMSKSDPFVVLFMQKPKSNQWYEVDRTEEIQDNHNPIFVKKFNLDFYFETVQNIKFEVYDVDDRSTRSLQNQDFLGQVTTTLAAVAFGRVSQTLKDRNNQGLIDKQTGKSFGQLIVTSEEILENGPNKNYTFDVSIDNCKTAEKGMFFNGTNNCFLKLSKANESGIFIPVYQSSKALSSKKGSYPRFSLDIRQLCNSDVHRTIAFEIIHLKSNGDVKNLHKMTFTPVELENQASITRNDEKMSMTVRSNVVTLPSFIEYLHSGLQLNFHVAVDYTASNGDPRTPASLHYLRNDGIMNSYEHAIHSIGSVIQEYDTDKMFPCYGFGARINGQVMHNFALTFDPNNTEVQGVEGILTAYKRSLQSLQLYGPTLFAPVVNKVANEVCQLESQSQHQSKICPYTILMILTDGIITDMDHTIKAIVDASSLPLSIIIIGVGSADFSAMERLDGDDDKLSYHGKYASRDIVQFVELNNFFNIQTGVCRIVVEKEIRIF